MDKQLGGRWFTGLVAARETLHGRFIASIFVRGGGALLALGVNVLLARMLGVAEFGHYMSVLSITLLLGGLAVRGTDQLATREFAGRLATGSGLDAGFGRWAVIRIGYSAALATALYVGWDFSRDAIHFPGIATSTLIPGIILIVAFAFCTLTAGVLNGLGAPLRSQSLIQIVKNLAILAMIAATSGVVGGLGKAGQALWLQAAACVFALVVGWVWLRPWFAEPIGFWKRASQNFSAAPTKRWSSASNHFLLVTVASLMVNRLDVVLISKLAGNESVGIYAAGARLAQVSLMAALAANVVFGPKIAAAWSRSDFVAARMLFMSAVKLTVPIAIIEILVALFLGNRIVGVFGADYKQATEPFIWVTLAYALWTAVAPAYALLGMTGSEKAVAALSWLVLIANVLGIFALVPFYGATGGAMAMTGGYILSTPLVLILVRNKLVSN